jgi:hypothetical protein
MRIMPPSELDTVEEVSWLLYAVTNKICNSPLNLNCRKICEIVNLDYGTIILMRNFFEKENPRVTFHFHQIRKVIEKILESFPSIKIYWMKTNVVRIKYLKSAPIKIVYKNMEKK